MAKLLTIRKQKWANKFKPDTIKGDPLNSNFGLAQRYYDRLAALIDRMTAEVEKKIKALYEEPHAEEYFAQDATISSQARILTNAISKKFNDLFASVAKPTAERVAKEADKSSAASVKSSIQQLSGGLQLSSEALESGALNDILNATVTENVALIKSISQQYLAGVQGAVMRSITTGNGLQDLVPYLERHKQITKRRALMIAHDQTRKAFNGLSKGRMQAVGLEQYEWLHTAGSNHPRREHIAMSGNIYRFDDPPVIDSKTGERGIPGQLPNCRCRMKPVLSFKK